MPRKRKLKTILTILVAFLLVVVPSAFSASYAQWTGGRPDVDGTFWIGKWETGDPSRPSDNEPLAFPDGFAGGVLIRGQNGQTIDPKDVSQDFYQNPNGGGAGTILIDEAFYIQIFYTSWVDDKPELKPADFKLKNSGEAKRDADGNYVIDANGMLVCEDIGITHIEGTYWYRLPYGGNYYFMAYEFANESYVQIIRGYEL